MGQSIHVGDFSQQHNSAAILFQQLNRTACQGFHIRYDDLIVHTFSHSQVSVFNGSILFQQSFIYQLEQYALFAQLPHKFVKSTLKLLYADCIFLPDILQPCATHWIQNRHIIDFLGVGNDATQSCEIIIEAPESLKPVSMRRKHRRMIPFSAAGQGIRIQMLTH